MAAHNELGKRGEDLAAEFFRNRKHIILNRNWRMGSHEIDLITTYNKVLHFIEVKTRSAKKFGFPEDSVNKTKFRFLKYAASSYLNMHGGYNKIQFDILSINIVGEDHECFLIEDVFW